MLLRLLFREFKQGVAPWTEFQLFSVYLYCGFVALVSNYSCLYWMKNGSPRCTFSYVSLRLTKKPKSLLRNSNEANIITTMQNPFPEDWPNPNQKTVVEYSSQSVHTLPGGIWIMIDFMNFDLISPHEFFGEF